MTEETKKLPVPSAAIPGKMQASAAYRSTSITKVPYGIAITADGNLAQNPLPLTDRQMQLLEARGIDLEMAARMEMRSSGRGGYGDALIDIPYFRGGKQVNCKTRSLDGEKVFFQQTGGEKCFYNVDAIAQLGEADLIITEGEMDCLIALQCGYMAVSVPDGAPQEKIGDRESVKYEYLNDIPKTVKRIILAVDNDNPGLNLQHDLAIRLGKHRCLFVKYPRGCKDLNDAYRLYGAKGVSETLARAEFIKINGLYKLSELPPLPIHPALDVGIPELSPHFKIRRGDFSVVTGIPSHGKSTFVNHLAYNMAHLHGWNICFASFEQPPQTEHRKALRTLHNCKPEHLQTSDELHEADVFLNDKFLFMVPSDDDGEEADLQWLKDRIAAAVTRYNCSLIVIDPWNELDHQYDQRSMSMTQYVGSAIKELKRIAKRFQIHVMVIAHPAKMRKGADSVYPIPTAHDISDSAHWYNKPEQVIVVHRQENGNTLVRIAKSRYHYALGKPGDVELKFNDYNGQFYSDKDMNTYGKGLYA